MITRSRVFVLAPILAGVFFAVSSLTLFAQVHPGSMEAVTDLERRRELYGASILPPAGDWLEQTVVEGFRLGLFRDLGQQKYKKGHTAIAELGYHWLQGCDTAEVCLQRGIEWMRSGDENTKTVAFHTAIDQSIDPHCVRFEAQQDVYKANDSRRRLFVAPAAGLLCTHPQEPTLFISLLYSERFPPKEHAAFVIADEAREIAASFRFEPLGPRVVGWTKLGKVAGGIAIGKDRLWVQHDRQISEIDSMSGAQRRRFAIPDDAFAIAHGDASLWVGQNKPPGILRLDPEGGAVAAQVKLNGIPVRIAAAFDFIWVQTATGLVRIDPANNTAGAELQDVAGMGLAAGHGSIWATGYETLFRIDPDMNTIVARVDVCTSPAAVVSTASQVWVTCPDSGQLFAVDPATNKVSDRRILGGSPLFAATTDESLWVSHRQHGAVSRVDPENATPALQVPIENGPFDIQNAFGYIWVTDRPAGKLYWIQP